MDRRDLGEFGHNEWDDSTNVGSSSEIPRLEDGEAIFVKLLSELESLSRERSQFRDELRKAVAEGEQMLETLARTS